jgi:hypothetical protein
VDGSNAVNLVAATGGPNAGGPLPGFARLEFAIDFAGNRIFSTTGNGTDIAVGPLDNSSNGSALYNNVGGPVNGIEYNASNDQIYFCQLGGPGAGIRVANATTPNTPTTLFPGSDFRQLVLDVPNGMIYWTDLVSSRIMSGPITGGTATPLFTGIVGAYGIDLDESTGTLYWTTIGGRVYSGDVNGTNQALLYSGFNNSRGITLGQIQSQPQPVPTLSQWGLILLALVMVNIAAVALWRRRFAAGRTFATV